MVRKTLCVILALLVGNAARAEPTYTAISASQTVGSKNFPSNTKVVTLVSDGASTCYFRLFSNKDTVGNATTSSSPLATGETITFSMRGQATTNVGTDSEGSATFYSSISYICSSGQTATWRAYSK